MTSSVSTVAWGWSHSLLFVNTNWPATSSGHICSQCRLEAFKETNWPLKTSTVFGVLGFMFHLLWTSGCFNTSDNSSLPVGDSFTWQTYVLVICPRPLPPSQPPLWSPFTCALLCSLGAILCYASVHLHMLFQQAGIPLVCLVISL